MEYKGKLPHFDHIGATFFVTFSLYNSLPVPIAKALKAERTNDREEIKTDKKLTDSEKEKKLEEIERKYFLKYDAILDSETYGDRYLSETTCMEIMKEVMAEYDGKYYLLEAYCVMPNHVHLLIDTSIQLPIDGSDIVIEKYKYLFQIMNKIKGKTGLLLNKHCGTSGQVWEYESFDKYIRNAIHFQRSLHYTLNNPVKATLVKEWSDWAGTYCREIKQIKAK